MNIKSQILLGIPLIAFLQLFAQPDSDHSYAKPLKDVLAEIQTRYGVTIRYADSIVANKTVKYAEWRYFNDVEETMDNVLKPLDMKVRKDGDKLSLKDADTARVATRHHQLSVRKEETGNPSVL